MCGSGGGGEVAQEASRTVGLGHDGDADDTRSVARGAGCYEHVEPRIEMPFAENESQQDEGMNEINARVPEFDLEMKARVGEVLGGMRGRRDDGVGDVYRRQVSERVAGIEKTGFARARSGGRPCSVVDPLGDVHRDAPPVCRTRGRTVCRSGCWEVAYTMLSNFSRARLRSDFQAPAAKLEEEWQHQTDVGQT